MTKEKIAEIKQELKFRTDDPFIEKVLEIINEFQAENEKLKEDKGKLMDIVSMQQKQIKLEQQETENLRRKIDIIFFEKVDG